MHSNRLNLSKMVDTKLTETSHAPQIFFDAQIITPNSLAAHDDEAMDEHPRSIFPKTSIATSWKSILSQMHTKLQARRPLTYEEPLSSILDDEMEDTKSVCDTSKALEAATKSPVVKKCPPPKQKSIPQMKANVQQKGQQRSRRVVAKPNDMNNFTNHKRVVEVLRQKRLLQDMLAQHERLVRDRRNIANEIHEMRSHVNGIREKLDQSLKKLKANPTVYETNTRSRRYKLAAAANTTANKSSGTIRRRNQQRVIPLTHNLLK